MLNVLTTKKKYKEMFKGDGYEYIYWLDCGDTIADVCICPLIIYIKHDVAKK